MTAVLVLLAIVVGVRLWSAITINALHGFAKNVGAVDAARDAWDRHSPTYGPIADATKAAR